MIKITDRDDINTLLSDLNEFQPMDFGKPKFFPIKEGWLAEMYYESDENPFLPLNGYEVKITKDGSHKTDGQMVEYTFTFKNPEGVETEIVTEMCLVIGFNRWDEIEIA